MAINDPILPQTPPPIPGAQPPALPPETVLGRTTKYELPADQPPREGWVTTPTSEGRTPIWLWAITLALLAVLIVLQRPEAEKPELIREQAAGLGEIKPPKADTYVLMCKLGYGLRDMFSGQSMPGQDPTEMVVQMSDEMAGWKKKDPFQPAGATNPPAKAKEPEPAVDRLHATIVAAEFLPAKDVGWRLKDIEQDLDPKSPLIEDVRIVRDVYGIEESSSTDDKTPDPTPASTTPASSGSTTPAKSGVTPEQAATARAAVAALPSSAQDGFRSRHGKFFGDLVLDRGAANDTTRENAASDGTAIVSLLVLFGVVVCLAGLTGFVLLIVGGSWMLTGRWQWRFRRPAPATEWPVGVPDTRDAHLAVHPHARHPSSVWLETVAVFFAMFLGVKGIAYLLERSGMPKEHLLPAALGLQWLVALAIFWPIVRGMSWERWRADIGWHKGRGVLREIGAGFLGYLAGLPVYFLMALLVVLATLVWSAISGSEPHPAGNKITDLVEGGSGWELLLLYLLATVWAPIVEESIFRGCLFRHLRRRVPLVVAALGSAFVFAVLHGYVVQGLFMVGTLGFWFALMREWRGSIIATATAHAIHNGTVMALLFSVLSFAKG